MTINFKKCLFAAGASVLAMSVLTGSPASADSLSAGTEEEPDQIIYVNRPAPESDDSAMVTQSDSGAKVTVVGQADFPVIPEPGETVQLVYTNAVTTVTTEPVNDAPEAKAAAGSCTRSVTAYDPYKTSFPQARAKGEGMMTSGCGGSRKLNVYLYRGTSTAASSSTTVIAGGSAMLSFGKTCKNSSKNIYYTQASWSLLGGGTTSAFKTLTCGY